MRVPIVALLAAACSSTRADAPRAGRSEPVAIAAAIDSGARSVTPPKLAPAKLALADLLAVEGTDIYPHMPDWNATYANLVQRFGPVTRIVERKYFWAAMEGERCAMFWIGKRKHLDQAAIAVGVLSTEPGGIGHDWCIAMATGGPLPARSDRSEPSTGFDSPTPE